MAASKRRTNSVGTCTSEKPKTQYSVKGGINCWLVTDRESKCEAPVLSHSTVPPANDTQRNVRTFLRKEDS